MLDSLTEAQKFALTALLEVTPVTTVGEFVGETDEGDHVVTYRFATTMSGYPGWNWAIAIADLPGEGPTIIESELLPAEGALLAPDWIPWADRMDDYRAAQIALGEAESEIAGLDDDEDDDESDDDDDDESDDEDDDDDLLGSDNLHSGDLDGVDIDELDVVIDDEDEDSDDDDSDDDELDSELRPEAELDVAQDLGLLDLQVDQGDDAESESGSGSENPPRVAGRRKRSSKEQQDD